MNNKEQKIIECFLQGWIESGMKIPGNVSYRDVMDLMIKLEVDASSISNEIKKIVFGLNPNQQILLRTALNELCEKS